MSANGRHQKTYRKRKENKMRTIELIKLGNIQENPLNIHKNDADDQVKIIADSITSIGLESPLVVYKDNIFAGKQMYTIISGHKRYAALKMLKKPAIFDVPCVIEEKPKDEIAEREILLQNNLGRKSPEEIRMQVAEASSIWNRLAPDVRQKYTDIFRNQFVIEESKSHNVDDKYIRDNFRPRLDYIRKMCGLDMSNSTVKSFLKKELDKTSEAFPIDPPKEKKITVNEILKRINSLSGIIEIYMSSSNISTNESIYLADLQTQLKDTAEELAA